MTTSEASPIWAQKSQDFQGLPLPMPRVMDVASLKTIRYKLHIKKNRYIGSFMYMSLVEAVLCVVVCRYYYGQEGGGGGVQSPDLPPSSHPTVGIQGWMVGGL
jgi:hypothetical protein